MCVYKKIENICELSQKLYRVNTDNMGGATRHGCSSCTLLLLLKKKKKESSHFSDKNISIVAGVSRNQ